MFLKLDDFRDGMGITTDRYINLGCITGIYIYTSDHSKEPSHQIEFGPDQGLTVTKSEFQRVLEGMQDFMA